IRAQSKSGPLFLTKVPRPKVNEPLLWNVIRKNCETLCERLFPLGRKEGSEWKIGDSTGAQGRSLGIRLTGENAGLCHDRATGQGWSLTTLLMETFGIDF